MLRRFRWTAAGLAHPLVDGDIVNFTAISPKFENSVTLRGNVAAPGRYPWHSGMRISDLIPNREFLITREYWKQQNAIVLESEATGGHVTGTTGTVNSVKRNAPEIDWDYAVVQRMSAARSLDPTDSVRSGQGHPGPGCRQQCDAAVG